MRVSPQQKRSNGATTFGGSCQQNPSAMWFLTLSKSPHIFKPAQEWMLADSNLITDLCAVWKKNTHTHSHSSVFMLNSLSWKHTHIHPHTIATCRNRLVRRKSHCKPRQSQCLATVTQWWWHCHGNVLLRSPAAVEWELWMPWTVFLSDGNLLKNKVSAGSHSYFLLFCQVERVIDRSLSKKFGLTKGNYRNIPTGIFNTS